MASFEIKIQVDAEIITELAENYMEYMELPDNYDSSALEARLAADPDFRQLVIDGVAHMCQVVTNDHWSYDLSDRISEGIGRVGWLAEVEQEINDADEVADFEDRLLRESNWVLEVNSAADMLKRLGWDVSRPIPKKRKQTK